MGVAWDVAQVVAPPQGRELYVAALAGGDAVVELHRDGAKTADVGTASPGSSFAARESLTVSEAGALAWAADETEIRTWTTGGGEVAIPGLHRVMPAVVRHGGAWYWSEVEDTGDMEATIYLRRDTGSVVETVSTVEVGPPPTPVAGFEGYVGRLYFTAAAAYGLVEWASGGVERRAVVRLAFGGGGSAGEEAIGAWFGSSGDRRGWPAVGGTAGGTLTADGQPDDDADEPSPLRVRDAALAPAWSDWGEPAWPLVGADEEVCVSPDGSEVFCAGGDGWLVLPTTWEVGVTPVLDNRAWGDAPSGTLRTQLRG